jgi:hypothetical protein
MVLWGATVLSFERLSPPRGYAVGEAFDERGHGTTPAGDVDFALSSELIGAARRPVVVLRHGAPWAVFEASAAVRLLEHGKRVDARAACVACDDVQPGWLGIELFEGRGVTLGIAGVELRVSGVEPALALPKAPFGGIDRSALTSIGAAALAQSLLIASLAYFTPSLGLASEEELDRERLVLMQQYLQAQAEREREREPAVDERSDRGAERGAPASASPGLPGKSGRHLAPHQTRRAGISGDHPERVVGRAQLIKEASNFGLAGMLATLNASTAPSSPWGAELGLGPDAANAHGDLWSPELGDVTGTGLALSGTDLGGSGPALGIGIGQIGDLGTCIGVSCYGKDGFARSAALGRRGHQSRAPRVRTGDPMLSGRLPKEVVQRVVRQNFGRFRQCYEVGLRTNPNLEGRVAVRFVIGRDGSVSNVALGGSDLPDPAVASCVAGTFYGLSFPSPENGIVTVTYPLMLVPG